MSDETNRGRADAAASRAPSEDELLTRLIEIMNTLHHGDGPHCNCGVKETIALIRDWQSKLAAGARATLQDDALIELNGQAIAALEKARRMLSTELNAGSFGHPDTMHHAKNIAQIVVEDIDNALMRNADGRVAAGARAVPSETMTRKVLAEMDPLIRIRELLHPTDATYSAEPIDIEDARWLLAQLDACAVPETQVGIVGFRWKANGVSYVDCLEHFNRQAHSGCEYDRLFAADAIGLVCGVCLEQLVPAVPVQDAPPKAWVLIGPAEQQGQGSMWACTKCGAAIQRHEYPEPESECEFCESPVFPAVQDALTTPKEQK